MVDLKSTQLQIVWAESVWDSFWGGKNEHMITQTKLNDFFQTMMFKEPDKFKFFHTDSGLLRIPIDINFTKTTILWAIAEDFEWDGYNSWYLKNPNSNTTFKIFKS